MHRNTFKYWSDMYFSMHAARLCTCLYLYYKWMNECSDAQFCEDNLQTFFLVAPTVETWSEAKAFFYRQIFSIEWICGCVRVSMAKINIPFDLMSSMENSICRAWYHHWSDSELEFPSQIKTTKFEYSLVSRNDLDLIILLDFFSCVLRD